MASNNPGPIRRLFRAIWNALNFTRRLVFNLIFLIVLAGLIGMLFSSRAVIAPRTALVLDPNGFTLGRGTLIFTGVAKTASSASTPSPRPSGSSIARRAPPGRRNSTCARSRNRSEALRCLT